MLRHRSEPNGPFDVSTAMAPPRCARTSDTSTKRTPMHANATASAWISFERRDMKSSTSILSCLLDDHERGRRRSVAEEQAAGGDPHPVTSIENREPRSACRELV